MAPVALRARHTLWTVVWAAVAISVATGSGSVVILTTLLVVVVALWDELDNRVWWLSGEPVNSRSQTEL